MCTAPIQAPAFPHVRELHERFLALLPRIEIHGRVCFRHLRCSQERADAVQEMRSLAWLWFFRMTRRGKDPGEFIGMFVTLLARAVRSGRRLTGLEKAKDAMNRVAQKRHGFRVEFLSSSSRAGCDRRFSSPHGQELQDAFEPRLADNTVTPVPDQAAFRIDWPDWLRTRSPRDRRIINDLTAGERTLDVSRKYRLSPARVSQLRQAFHHDWLRFNDGGRDTSGRVEAVA